MRKSSCHPLAVVPGPKRTGNRRHRPRGNTRGWRPPAAVRLDAPATVPALEGPKEAGWQQHTSSARTGYVSRSSPSERLCGGFLLRGSKNLAQALTCDQIFSGFHRHGNQFYVFGWLGLLTITIRVAFTDRFYQARIIRTQHFHAWVAGAEFFHAVCNRKSPSLLIPRNSQRRIAVSIFWDENIRLDTGNRFYQLANPLHAAVPLGVEFLLIQAQPGFQRGQTSDDLFLADLHRTTYCSFSRIGVHQGGFDQVFSSQEKPAAL